MGILSRFSTIMKSNINALLDKAEDPVKMADQLHREALEDLAEVKKETATVMAAESKAKRAVDDCQAEVTKFENAAKNALRSGNEDDARTLLQRKQEKEATLAGLQEAYAAAQQNTKNIRAMYDKLESDVRAIEARKAAIKTKAAVANAQETVNRVASGTAKKGSAISELDKLDARVSERLDVANASAQLDAEKAAEDGLVDKYSSASPAAVDDELARMKAELGIE